MFKRRSKTFYNCSKITQTLVCMQKHNPTYEVCCMLFYSAYPFFLWIHPGLQANLSFSYKNCRKLDNRKIFGSLVVSITNIKYQKNAFLFHPILPTSITLFLSLNYFFPCNSKKFHFHPIFKSKHVLTFQFY